MKLPKELEAEILARADKVGPCAKITDELDEERAIYRDPPEFTGPGAGQTDVPMPPHLKKSLKKLSMEAWTFMVPYWMPTPINKLYDRHWIDRRRHKQSDAELVAHYGRSVPKATGKRSVALHVVFPPKKRMPDVDALGKSLLDALVGCGILKNDSAPWCRLEPVAYSRGDELLSFITIREVNH